MDLGILKRVYEKKRANFEFRFDQLWAPSIYNFLSFMDIDYLHQIAISDARTKVKYDLINQLMTSRGFKKFAAGTNRVVYSYLENDTFLVKIAIDKVGLRDSPAEFMNQALLQPYVTKCFEVTPCGTVGVFERVTPITSIEQFETVADYVFGALDSINGKYIMDDIGCKYFMNWGIREGWGPCILDYPYLYELDARKAYCNSVDRITGAHCGGEIEYDKGFNDLVCTKCGRRYLARDLQKDIKENLIITEVDNTMKVSIIRGDEIIACNDERSSDHIIINRKEVKTKTSKELKVSIIVESDDEEIIAPKNTVVEEKTETVSENTEETKEEISVEEKKETWEANTSFNSTEFIPSKEEPVEEETNNGDSEEKKADFVRNEKSADNKRAKRDSRGRFVKSYDDDDDTEYEEKRREKEKAKKKYREERNRNKNLDLY